MTNEQRKALDDLKAALSRDGYTVTHEMIGGTLWIYANDGEEGLTWHMAPGDLLTLT